MKGSSAFSIIVPAIASLFISTSASACIFPFTDTEMKSRAMYHVTDHQDNTVVYLDGVQDGTMVSGSGNRHVDVSMVKGDKITNMETNKSGVITGVRHQGTMDVVKPDGKVVRYQYVTFKVRR